MVVVELLLTLTVIACTLPMHQKTSPLLLTAVRFSCILVETWLFAGVHSFGWMSLCALTVAHYLLAACDVGGAMHLASNLGLLVLNGA